MTLDLPDEVVVPQASSGRDEDAVRPKDPLMKSMQTVAVESLDERLGSDDRTPQSLAAPERFVGYILSTILGGGVSSRLFLKIREQAGLAYAVYSDQTLYADAGCMTVYAGTSVDATPQVIGLILAEFRDLKANAVSAVELRRAKDHLKGSLTLSLESTSSRMSNLARQEKYFRKWISLEEVHEGIEAVTAEQVQGLANSWFQQDTVALAVLGTLNGLQIERADLAC